MTDELTPLEESLKEDYAKLQEEPEPEPASEPGPEPTPEPTPEPEKSGSEHAKGRKKLRERLEDVERTNAFLAGQLQQVNRQPEPTPAPKPEFDPDLQPDEWMRENLRQTNEAMVIMAQKLRQNEATTTAQQLAMQAKEAETSAVKDNPDYHDQKKFVEDRQYALIRRQAAVALKSENPNADDNEINDFLDKRANDIRATARRNVEAEVIKTAYTKRDLAKEMTSLAETFGYQKKASQVEQKTNTRAIEQNKNKSASLNGSSSRGKTQLPTQEDMVEMTTEELLAYSTRDLTKIASGVV